MRLKMKTAWILNRRKENEMSERRSGRKKHLVEGEVTEVKRSSRGLGTYERVGEGSCFMRAFRRMLKGLKDEKEEK